ncbi:MAG TPA: hypothetical protein VLT87_11000 [Thermoanaerobaculia bacterium]|nr:hypothetical protein [Thermoanaerobaculia bacterium]
MIRDLQRLAARIVIPAFGGNAIATLKVPHTLRYRGRGVSALDVSESEVAGSSAVTFTASGVTGGLPEGCKVQFAGHGTTYSVAAATEVASGELSVSLSPNLVQGVEAGESANLPQPYASHSYRVARRSAQEVADEREEPQVGAQYELLPLNSAPEPKEDWSFEGLGRTGSIRKVQPVGSAGAVAYIVTVGDPR